MISPSLPAALKAALEARLEGVSRADIAGRAATISKGYRDGGNSGTIRTDADALAYALARMPATYAALIASLNALREMRGDFTPHTLLDVGAGPGTASFAAAEAFSSLQTFALIDANAALRALALDLALAQSRFGDLRYDQGEARTLLAEAEPADLVVASYVIGELAETERGRLVESLWAKTRDTLLIVEPGTPAGHARILAARARLIAEGGLVIAPCPHEGACPLQPPDWCHFVQRLARSRAHMQMKGAEVPFEDEKFSYVALTRRPPGRRGARVLAQPVAGKAEIAARLCTAEGLVTMRVRRRDRGDYAQARHWRWGDAVMKDD